MRMLKLYLLVLASCFLPQLAQARLAAPSSVSDGARVFAGVRPAVVALRTSLIDSEQRNSSASGFQVDARGWTITNFHVVADYLFDPARYRLHYETASGGQGEAEVIAVDVLNDLALVAPRKPLPKGDARPLALPTPGATNRLPKGEAIYAVGNPLDLGMTVSVGTYSGVVEGTFEERIHFTGVLNPGMSGGPALDRTGRLVGINVSHSFGRESVSFLVPAIHAVRLYADASRQSALPIAELRPTIARQMQERQAKLAELALAKPWAGESLGKYKVPNFLGDYMDCGAASNESANAPPPVAAKAIACALKTSVMPAPEARSSTLSYRHTLIRPRSPDTLNAFQLAAAASPRFLNGMAIAQNSVMARQVCRNSYTQAGPAQELPVRLAWCAQGYRDFPGLYDFQIAVATLDADQSVLVSRLTLEGFTWENALALTQRLLEEIQ